MATGTLKYVDDSGNVTPMYPTTILATAVTATSTDGVAYTATVAGISALTAGLSFTFVPSTVSTSATCTLNVNGLGAKTLRLRSAGYTATTIAPPAANWMASGKPVRVTYDGLWWVCDLLGDVGSSPKAKLVTLTVAGWSSTALTQSVTVSGILADESKQLIQPMPTAASMDAYRNAGIRCTGQAKDTLTFTCDTVPTAEISVYVTYQEVTVV